ncbi:MAG: hypothetical protein Q8R45_08300 [Brevundimonas sp.]|nr:hypothetical protein [Brevundimonas sp.]MDP3656948.1 hypothetical protein [Brevundimonas sp.]MDZ4111418.1 hypothetical protein [Brevundimonas sp.]
MTTTKLNLVSFGCARALTRDGAGVEHLELNIRNGKYPVAG